MIHYTDALTTLISDVAARVEPLRFIDQRTLLVFARFGRSGAEGAYATCHSLNLPNTEPGYYFWRDKASGRITRRSEWFVTKTPEVTMGNRRIDYLLSFTIPRFCDQTLTGSRKAVFYSGDEPWISKLDTVIHELYHISPHEAGLRRFERSDGAELAGCHSPTFLADVAGFVHAYLKTKPDPACYEFLKYDYAGLVARYGTVAGTTFSNFPSYPQRYAEAAPVSVESTAVEIVPVRRSSQPFRYTERDLQQRVFTERGSRRWPSRRLLHTAA